MAGAITKTATIRRYIGRVLLLGMMTAAASGCGSSTDIALSETLSVVMVGAFEAPADAIGNAEPKSLKFTLEGVTLTAEDGSLVELYTEDPAEYSIISRPQIVFEGDVSEHADKNFSAVSVSFAPEVIGAGKYEDELATTLTSATTTYANAFKIETAKSLRLEIKVQWKSIIWRDEDADPPTETMSSPAFVAAFSD